MKNRLPFYNRELRRKIFLIFLLKLIKKIKSEIDFHGLYVKFMTWDSCLRVWEREMW